MPLRRIRPERIEQSSAEGAKCDSAKKTRNNHVPVTWSRNDMERKTATSTANTAYGKPLATPIDYSYQWDIYTSKAEVDAANDNLSDEEVIKVRNNEHQSNARQKALQAALDAAGIVRPTLENDDQLRLREFFKVLMSSKKYTEDAARALAASTLGLEWAE
jgi:hypothetical protein